jgi:hypothetical protein
VDKLEGWVSKKNRGMGGEVNRYAEKICSSPIIPLWNVVYGMYSKCSYCSVRYKVKLAKKKKNLKYFVGCCNRTYQNNYYLTKQGSFYQREDNGWKMGIL